MVTLSNHDEVRLHDQIVRSLLAGFLTRDQKYIDAGFIYAARQQVKKNLSPLDIKNKQHLAALDSVGLSNMGSGAERYRALTEGDYQQVHTGLLKIVESKKKKFIPFIDGRHFVELGPGTAVYTSQFFDATCAPHSYSWFDIAAENGTSAAMRLTQAGINVVGGRVGDFNDHRMLRDFIAAARVAGSGRPLTIALMGHTIGNMFRSQAANLLFRFKENMIPGDAVVIDTAYAQPPSLLREKYDNKEIEVVLKTTLRDACDFVGIIGMDLSDFVFKLSPSALGVNRTLICQNDQTWHISTHAGNRRTGLISINVDAGEGISFLPSNVYNDQNFRDLFREAAFEEIMRPAFNKWQGYYIAEYPKI